MMNKRVLSFVLCVIMVASLFTGMVSSASADYDTVTYSVKNGDYLFKICKGYGLDYYACKNAIMILNGFVSEAQLNRLTVGQAITLPASNAIAATVKGSTSTTTTTTQTVTINGVTTTTSSTSTLSGVSANYAVAYYLIPHVMQYGETLASVCNDLGTSYGAYSSVILAANGITNANNVWAGKTVYIPSTKAPTAGACYAVVAHTVSSGETMTSICSQYGQSYNANATLINGLNRSTNLNKIYVGQTLYIPVVATAATGTGTGTGTGSATAVQSGYNINFKYSSTEGLPYAKIGDTTVTKADAGKTIVVYAGAKNGCALKSITVTRTDNNANVVVTDRKFTMPPCDVDVTMVYSKGLKITRNVVNLNSGTFETLVNGEAAEYASYGDLVTLSFKPKTGYSAQLVKMTPAGGSASILKQNTDGTYSFKMPNSEVTIDVTFEEATLNPINSKFIDYYYYKLSNDYSHNLTDAGKITYTVDGVQNTKAAKNAQVVATVSANSNYKLSNVVVCKAGSDPSVAANQITVTKKDGKYVFKMPDYAPGVDVYAMYSVTYSISAAKPSVNPNGGSITFSSDDKVYKQITRQVAGERVYIIAAPASGYELTNTPSDIKATYAKGASSTPVTVEIGDDHPSFVMPPNAVTVTPAWITGNDYHTITAKTVNCSATIKVKDSFNEFVNNNKAKVGKEVKIYISPKAGFVEKTIEVIPTTLTYTHGTDKNGDFIQFTMPNENVKFTLTYDQDLSTVKIAGSIIMDDGAKEVPEIKVLVNGEVTDNARAGYVVKTSFKIPEGYKIKTDSDGNQIDCNIARYDTGNLLVPPKTPIKSDGNGVFTYQIRETDLASAIDKVVFEITLAPTKENTQYQILKSSNTYEIRIDDAAGEVTPLQAYKEHVVHIVNTDTTKKIKTATAFTGDAGSPKYLELKPLPGGNEYTFVMPGEAVTTDVELAQRRTIYCTGDANATPTTIPTPEIAGEIVTAVFDFASGYEPDTIKADGVEMPEGSYVWDKDNLMLTITYTVKDTGNVIEVTSK